MPSDAVILAVIVAISTALGVVFNFILQSRLQPHQAAALDAETKDKKAETDQKNTDNIISMQGTLAQMQSSQAGMLDTIATQERRIATQELELGRANIKIEAQEKRIAEQDKRLADQDARISTQDAEIARLSRLLTESTDRELKLKQDVDHMPEEIQRLKEMLRKRGLIDDEITHASVLDPAAKELVKGAEQVSAATPDAPTIEGDIVISNIKPTE